jgi:hypothetical protein
LDPVSTLRDFEAHWLRFRDIEILRSTSQVHAFLLGFVDSADRGGAAGEDDLGVGGEGASGHEEELEWDPYGDDLYVEDYSYAYDDCENFDAFDGGGW